MRDSISSVILTRCKGSASGLGGSMVDPRKSDRAKNAAPPDNPAEVCPLRVLLGPGWISEKVTAKKRRSALDSRCKGSASGLGGSLVDPRKSDRAKNAAPPDNPAEVCPLRVLLGPGWISEKVTAKKRRSALDSRCKGSASGLWGVDGGSAEK